MNINKERLCNTLNHIGEIGKSEDGINRVAFSDTYFAAREEVKNIMESHGLTVRMDSAGNIFGRRSGSDNSLPVIMVGSHLDTVKNGGLYDGNLGVSAAIECISALDDCGIATDHPIEVAAFNAEEGSELGGTFGSRVAMGLQRLDLPDIDKKLSIYGLTPDDIRSSAIDYGVHCYMELHIEQGINLYNEHIPVGVVEGIVGITRYKITVCGEANHAGTTPMAFRKDAVVAAAQLITVINAKAVQIGDPFVATVGKLSVTPNSVNVIPGKVEMILEIRDMSKERIESYFNDIRQAAAKIEGVSISFEPYSDKGSVVLNKGMMHLFEDVCDSLNIKYRRMFSGAGHDAMEIAKKVPTGLIFIPSRDGISHSKDEYSSLDDMVIGTQVLYEALIKADKIECIEKYIES